MSGSASAITPESIVARSEDQVAAEIDGEFVMMSIEQGHYYGLDEIGSRVWEMIETPQTIDALVNALLKEFKVTQEVCQRDIIALLTQMHNEKLVNVVNK